MASNSVFTAEKTEIGEIESFSVRRTGWDTWDASLPWESLADCVQVLTQAYAMPPGSIARGTVYQVQNIYDNYRPQSILQWLDTQDRTYVLSLYYDELPTLTAVLADLADDNDEALDLDLSKLTRIKPGNRFDLQLAQAVKNEETELSKAISESVASEIPDESSPVGSATASAIRARVERSTGLNVLDFGAVGNGVVDDTAALQSAISAAAPGQSVIFPATGAGGYYFTSETLLVTTPNIRLVGQPRDGYAVAVRSTAATMIEVKTTGFVLEDLGLIGNGGLNGEGSTVNGLVFYGDVDGNIDANLRGATLQGLNVAVRSRGRNLIVDGAQTLVSNCLSGFVVDGPDGAYHTGPNSSQIRGLSFFGIRFHNIGVNSTTSCIQVLPASKLLHAFITGCYHDSNGLGKFLKVTGTVADPCKGITATGNKHTELSGDAYDLTYVTNSFVSNAHILAWAGVGGNTASAVVLNNCDTVVVSDILGVQLGGDGVYARNSTKVQVSGVRFRTLGGDGFDIDSTNSMVSLLDVSVEGAGGYGVNGSPSDSKLRGYEFRSCTLGRFNSSTLTPDQIFVSAQDFLSITGTPNLIGVPGAGYPGSWQFDSAATEQVTAAVGMLPADWGSFNIVVMWASTSVGTGNVVWQISRSNLINGQLPSSGAASNNSTQAASGVSGRVLEFTAVSDLPRPVNPLAIRVARAATDVSDTYGDDAALIGIRLVRAG